MSPSDEERFFALKIRRVVTALSCGADLPPQVKSLASLEAKLAGLSTDPTIRMRSIVALSTGRLPTSIESARYEEELRDDVHSEKFLHRIWNSDAARHYRASKARRVYTQSKILCKKILKKILRYG